MQGMHRRRRHQLCAPSAGLIALHSSVPAPLRNVVTKFTFIDPKLRMMRAPPTFHVLSALSSRAVADARRGGHTDAFTLPCRRSWYRACGAAPQGDHSKLTMARRSRLCTHITPK